MCTCECRCPRHPEEGVGIPGAGAAGCGCWTLNLREQEALLASEPDLQLWQLIVLKQQFVFGLVFFLV